MKRNKCFLLREIGQVPYLLPFGQAIADQQRGCRINETGAYLWRLLERDTTPEELLEALAAHYDASQEDLPGLKKDLEEFLSTLRYFGILVEDGPASVDAPFVRYLRAGGLNLKFVGMPVTLPEQFDGFGCGEPSHVHQTICIHPRRPRRHINGELLIRNEEFALIDAVSQYLLLFPSSSQILEARLLKDGSRVVFYCIPPFTERFREELFHAIRIPFLYLAQQHDRVILHSASLLYRGKAWLFSGPSGTGKSTHTNLWHERFQTPLLNGDLNLLAWEEGQPLIQGIPWCGTSGICDTGTHPLGGIVLLKQAPDNHLRELSADERRLMVLQRLISPAWTAEQHDRNLRFVERLADAIYITRFHCTKEISAAEIMRGAINGYLETQPGGSL